MNKILRILALCLASAAMSAQAMESPWLLRQRDVLSCPAVGTSYNSMLNDLESLKTSIRGEANCENVKIKIKDVGAQVTDVRKRFLELIEKSKTTPLTAQENQEIQDYTENLAENVATLFDLFSNSNYCFSDDPNAANKMASLAGFVNEASRMLGSVAGAWGAPIAIGGRVVAGLITAIDQYSKTRAGYDFTQPKQWRNYVNSLCTYYNFRDEIASLLYPEQQAQNLADLANKLNTQLTMITARCPECKKINDTIVANPKADPTVIIRMTEPSVASANSAFTKPLGSYTLETAGLLQWATAERKRILADAKDFLQDSSGRYLLFKAKENLDDFLIERMGPKFLDAQLSDAVAQFRQFTTFVERKGATLAMTLAYYDPNNEAMQTPWMGWDAETLFNLLVKNEMDLGRIKQPRTKVDDLKFALSSFRAEALEKLNSYRVAVGAYENFCQFFRLSNNYTSSIRTSCLTPRYSQLKTMEAKYVTEANPPAERFSQSVIEAIEATLAELQAEPGFLDPRQL